MMPHEKLKAWQLAHELALRVFELSDSWPTAERYLLTAQIRRAALSAPANIPEGAAKRGPREFRRFLDIAFGSLTELSYLLFFARERGLLSAHEWHGLDGLRDEARRTLWGLLRSITRASRACATNFMRRS